MLLGCLSFKHCVGVCAILSTLGCFFAIRLITVSYQFDGGGVVNSVANTGFLVRYIGGGVKAVRNPDSVKVKSEFRAGTSKIFRNSEDKATTKNLSDKTLIIASAKASFFDIKGIQELNIRPA